MRSAVICSVIVLFLGLPPAAADDWPQWLGPDRDSVWRERGIVDQFPEGGLPVEWRASVGLGYAGPAVADGKVYVTDYVRDSGKITNTAGRRDRLQGTERVLCFDAATGERLWKHAYEREYHISYPSGPRCTPTVDDGKVYTLGAEGDLLCLNADDGRVIWHKRLTEEYDTVTPHWGFAAHPLVDGDRLYCMVGGKGSVVVALNKNTGEEIWRSLSAGEPGYCPPTLIEHGGTRQLVVWHPQALNGLNPATGEKYWSVDLEPSFHMAISAPRKHGSYLFASAYQHVGALLKLKEQKPAVEVVWRGTPQTAVYCATNTPFIDDGMIYGCDSQKGMLMGVRLKDGKRLWKTLKPTTGGERPEKYGTAYIVKHRDRFFLFSETGDLILADLSRDGYEEIDRAKLLEPTNTHGGRDVVWSHPAFADRSVFARNDEELVRVNLAAERE